MASLGTYALNKNPLAPTATQIAEFTYSFGINYIVQFGDTRFISYNTSGIEELKFNLPELRNGAYIFKDTVFGGTTYTKGWYTLEYGGTDGAISLITPMTPPDTVDFDAYNYTVHSQSYFNELFTEVILKLTPFLTSVADAIRTKEGTTAKINPQDFANKITNLPSGGGVNFEELNSKKWGSPVGYSVTLQDPDGFGGNTQYSTDNGTTWISFVGGTTINGITDIMFKSGVGETLTSDANNLNFSIGSMSATATTQNYTLTKDVVVTIGFL